MEQPKKDLRLTKEEQDRNSSVTKQSTTSTFANNVKETQKVEVNSEGKANPITQKRKIQFAKPGSGKKTRIIAEDGSVLHELEPGSDKEKEMIRRVRAQEADTNARRKKSAEVINYQTGDTDGNRVFEERYNTQNPTPKKKVIIKK